MPQSTMLYVLSHITQNIPMPILELAFRPRQYNTTVENRIISQVVEGPVLLDTNLVGGKPRVIILNANWQMNLPDIEEFGILGAGMESAFYQVPPAAREYRNISSILGISAYIGGSFDGFGAGYSNQDGFGNTATGLMSEMVSSYTLGNSPPLPQVTLEGTNILKFTPQLVTEGLGIRVMLEHDAEFLNVNPSMIVALQRFCLCATQRYIVKELLVQIDETEIVAGMEIGIIKTLVQKYQDEAEKYNELLMKLKGAMHYDPSSISRIIYHSL